MLTNRELKTFWRTPSADVRAVLEPLVRLRQQACYADPLIIGGKFGKGRVVAVLTTAGKAWNDFAGGSPASILYPAFIWEAFNYLTTSAAPETPKAALVPGKPPQFLDIDLDHFYRPRNTSKRTCPTNWRTLSSSRRTRSCRFAVLCRTQPD